MVKNDAGNEYSSKSISMTNQNKAKGFLILTCRNTPSYSDLRSLFISDLRFSASGSKHTKSLHLSFSMATSRSKKAD